MRSTIQAQIGLTQRVVTKNLTGISHQQSLLAPAPAGNCLNWVVGHIVWSRDILLRMMGDTGLWSERQAELYGPGSDPLTAVTHGIVPLEMLSNYLIESHTRIVRRIDLLTDPMLERVVAGPRGSHPLAEQLAAMVFHEAYHAGQTGLLRRFVGLGSAV